VSRSAVHESSHSGTERQRSHLQGLMCDKALYEVQGDLDQGCFAGLDGLSQNIQYACTWSDMCCKTGGGSHCCARSVRHTRTQSAFEKFADCLRSHICSTCISFYYSCYYKAVFTCRLRLFFYRAEYTPGSRTRPISISRNKRSRQHGVQTKSTPCVLVLNEGTGRSSRCLDQLHRCEETYRGRPRH
jgi:hypothetical protein